MLRMTGICKGRSGVVDKWGEYGKRLVAVVVIRIAVDLIASGLGGDVEVAAGAAAGFAVAGGLERVLVERVDGKDNAGDAADAALVDCVHVQVQIVVVGAVDGVVDLVAARAVDRAGVVVAGKGHRGAEELSKVAAVEAGMRLLRGHFVGGVGGKEDAHRGSMAFGFSAAIDADAAAVAFDELAGDEQSDSCTDHRTCGEECVEYPGQDCGRDPHAIVRNGEENSLRWERGVDY